MSIIEKLVGYKESSVYVEINNDRLLIKGKEASITNELKLELKQFKNEILAQYKKLNIKSNKQLAPSSYSQQRLWFLEMMQGGSSNYNIIDLRLV